MRITMQVSIPIGTCTKFPICAHSLEQNLERTMRSCTVREYACKTRARGGQVDLGRASINQVSDD